MNKSRASDKKGVETIKVQHNPINKVYRGIKEKS